MVLLKFIVKPLEMGYGFFFKEHDFKDIIEI